MAPAQGSNGVGSISASTAATSGLSSSSSDGWGARDARDDDMQPPLKPEGDTTDATTTDGSTSSGGSKSDGDSEEYLRPVRDCSCACLEASPHKQGWLESGLAVVTLGVVCGWFYILLLLEGALIAHAVIARSPWSATAAALLLASCWVPPKSRLPCEPFIYGPLFRLWRRYFDWSCVVEEPLDPSRRYMFAEMPHGVIPLAALLSVSVVRHAFPGLRYVSGVAASITLRIPLIRQLFGWSGIRPAGPNTIRDMYQDGVHVAVVVGGIAEMFLVSRKEERIFLKERKGFVRVAIRNGADIVPVFFFGSSLLFDLVGGPESNGLLMRISRRLRSSLVLFTGRWYTPVPHRQPIKMVTGTPIRVEQSDQPSDEYVDAIHGELVARVQRLYETHRPAWEQRPLVIM